MAWFLLGFGDWKLWVLLGVLILRVLSPHEVFLAVFWSDGTGWVVDDKHMGIWDDKTPD